MTTLHRVLNVCAIVAGAVTLALALFFLLTVVYHVYVDREGVPDIEPFARFVFPPDGTHGRVQFQTAAADRSAVQFQRETARAGAASWSSCTSRTACSLLNGALGLRSLDCVRVTPPVTDQFVDKLFEKLHARRQEKVTQAATATEARARVAEAARAWWDEFCQEIEHRIDAWNAKDEPDARIRHTRNADGTLVLWHRSVEAQLCLADARVVMTGRVGDTQPRQSPFIEFSEARGNVSAILAGAHAAQSPCEAADHLLEPFLTHAFCG